MENKTPKVEHISGGEPQVKPANGKRPVGPDMKTYAERPANPKGYGSKGK